MKRPRLRVLASDNNVRGDLFTRIVADVFHSLGFDVTGVNVARTGAEIDIEGRHRFESQRFLVAECKATADPVGGALLNKFAGVAEVSHERWIRRWGDVTLSAYYVSLSGFTASAYAQEAELSHRRMILLDGAALLQQLIDGHIVAPVLKAVDAARAQLQPQLTLNAVELWISLQGNFWALVYGDGKGATSVVLVHADGTVVPATVAEKVFAEAREEDEFWNAVLVSPPGEKRSSVAEAAREAYAKYLAAVCGEIQLDGLPADEVVGSKRLQLENLFVPLRLLTTIPLRANDDAESVIANYEQVEPAGFVLDRNPRMAILAPPGAGKSTLLKRIAVAYMFPDRKERSDDQLPDREWFPLFIRCRDLGADAHASISTILSGLARRAEMDAALRTGFDELVGEALRAGTALLLVDGLDEIANDRDRVAFVMNLRTFIAIYSAAALVVTSREAGFRIVAPSLAVECRNFRIAGFEDQDIERLVQRWHTEVYGPSAEGVRAAAALAQTILGSDRIRALAVNPLLLTTLLLVRRWVGQLPTKRSVLYRHAIEVLLATWNVQAHDPIDLDEALPRLEYIAYSMMKRGAQRITLDELRSLLREARKELAEALAFSTMRDEDFVERIELRSSLLILAGQTIEAGSPVALYEFRHLTFQEYLVACAIAHGNHSDRRHADRPVEVLAPHLNDPAWKEIIALTAVFVGRNARSIIEALTTPGDDVGRVRVVAQCILDEVHLTPDVLDATLLWLARRSQAIKEALPALAGGKFGKRLLSVVWEEFSAFNDLPTLTLALRMIVAAHAGWTQSTDSDAFADALRHTEDALLAGSMLHVAYNSSYRDREASVRLIPLIARQLHGTVPAVAYAAAYAIEILGDRTIFSIADYPSLLPGLAMLCQPKNPMPLRSTAAAAICMIARANRASLGFGELTTRSAEELGWLISTLRNESEATLHDAGLVLQYYFGDRWQFAEALKSERGVVAHRLALFAEVDAQAPTARSPRPRRPRTGS